MLGLLGMNLAGINIKGLETALLQVQVDVALRLVVLVIITHRCLRTRMGITRYQGFSVCETQRIEGVFMQSP